MTDTTYLYFKTSGKFYAEGKGNWPEDPFGKGPTGSWLFQRHEIKKANGGCLPGLSTNGLDFFIVVIPSKDNEGRTVWPRLIRPEEVAHG